MAAENVDTAAPARLAFIDGLRGLAILGVVAVHLAQALLFTGVTDFHTNVLKKFVEAGARGVDLFFIISAFTLFGSSRFRFERDSFPKLSFYIRRACRILPPWWMAIVTYIIVDQRLWPSGVPSLLMYFGFVRFDANREVFSLGWSIFVEETFYLLLPFIFFYIKDLRRATIFFVQTCLLAILWEQLAGKLGIPDGNNFIYLFPLNHWFALALGIVIYFLNQETRFQELVIENRQAAPLLDAVTTIVLFQLIRQEHMAASFGLFLLFVTAMSPHTLWGKLSRNKFLGRWGICCYSIYLFHLAILNKLAPVLRDVLHAGLGRAALDIKFFVAFPIAALACLAFGSLFYVCVENPCIQLGRWINRRIEKSVAARAASQPT